ncbi:hypothetical protein PENSPDRAFT_621174 [Peniophora sp. CONT]|nr:hypothetical protein PENSPDRAFT_621174 [Peniophora sp. CONT]
MTYLQSSQNFVRALKAPNDPPSADSPAKIDIAREVWEQASFNVQNKAEAIVEFILTRLLKEKGKTADSPITDRRYWDLLSSALSALSLSTSSAASTKAWLLPLLNRVPLVPICTSLLERSSQVNAESAIAVLDLSAQAIATLWPLASPKFTADVLLDCFGALLSVAARFPTESAGLSKLGSLINTSLQEAFSHSSNKKKLYQTFTQSHLQSWVVCVACLKMEDSASALITDVYRTGREILFNADTLKSLSEPSFLKTLLASFPVTEPSLQALPKLLQAFAVATRKQRTLFGQGTSAQTAARAVAMLFFATCTDYVRSAPSELSTAACVARLALLRIVEEESLLGFGQMEGQQAMQKEVGLCISALPSDSTPSSDSVVLLESLCVVSRIDHDLLEPHLSELLPRMLHIPPRPDPAAASASELLTLCITYHSRARSLPSFLGQIKTVFASLASSEGSIRELYPRVAGSPLLARSFLAGLSKSMQTFVTPGQVLSTAQDVLYSLTPAYETFTNLAAQAAGDSGLGSRKKARKSRASTGAQSHSEAAGVDAAAVSFALLARVAACVLPALPIQTVTPAVQEEVRACIHQADFVKGDLLNPEMRGDNDRESNVWAVDIVLAAALRLVYALQAATRLQFPSSQPERNVALAKVQHRSDVLPELFLEMSRYLLKTVTSEDSEERTVVFERILVFLEQHLRTSQAWNGRSAELAYGDDGASQAATGLLRLVLDRFLHVFDAIASQVQMDRLVELLSKAASSSHVTADALTPRMVAKDCLRSAQLWEQRRLRSSLLSSITTRLQGIDTVHVETVTDAPPHSLSLMSSGLKSGALDRALEGFHLLLYCPPEYLSKSSRADSLRRAVTFDMALTAVEPVEHENPLASQVVRTFLQRTFHAVGSAEHQYAQAYLKSLVRSAGVDGTDDKITLDIIDAHVRTVFRVAQRGPVDAASELLASLLPLQPRQSSPIVDQRMDILRERVMSVLTQDFAVDSFPADLKSALYTYQERISTRIEDLSNTSSTADEGLRNGSVIALASAHIRFSSWLGLTDVNSMPLKATDLIRALTTSMSRSSARGLDELVFGLLVAEFECSANARADLLTQMLASYVVFSQQGNPSDYSVLDERVLGATRRFSVEEFAFSLDLIDELLSNGQDAEHLSHTVRLGSVLLRGAPEGTLKTTQAFFTRVLCTFIDHPQFTSYSPLRTQALVFLDQQCRENPASLRLINLTTIWPLLSRVTSGSPTRDEQASPETFHKVVSIVGALIRLRRDLVVNTLPHLCVILRLLITCLRGPRPNLGEKQRQVVADSLPAWVDLDHPLGAEESKALARLMTTLATKTIVRVHASSSESQKADSLSRPLSKHVAYVLQAYIAAVNDPLCVVPLPVRQELMPGLFVLCGMLNEHDRDALMVSGMDAAGKVTLKALWRDYEKQRYVGKG